MMMDLFVFGTSHQIFDGYTNKIEKPKIFSKIISPGEKNMNFVKIIFSGERKILSV